MSTEPLFWYRPRTDGGYEGPLHNGQIEDVRKASGAWVPLFAGAAPVSAEPVAYLDLGAGGYVDVGTDLTDEQLAALPKGRHMLAIVGTYGVEGFTAAPVAAQPDLTQQTLDDVKAGLPARDAEIGALRKEIDTLRAQQDADTVDAERYRAWRDALITGKTAEDDFIRLVADSLPTSVGVSRRPTAAEWDAAIDAARKENSNA